MTPHGVHGVPPAPGMSGAIRFGWRGEYVLCAAAYWTPPELLVGLALPLGHGLWPLLAHLLVLMLVLIPAAALEATLGQRAQRGLLGVWGFSPIWRGLGHLLIIYNILDCCHLASILADMVPDYRRLLLSSSAPANFSTEPLPWRGPRQDPLLSMHVAPLERGIALVCCALLVFFLCPGPRIWGKPISFLVLCVPCSLTVLLGVALTHPDAVNQLGTLLLRGTSLQPGGSGKSLLDSASLLNRIIYALRAVFTGGHLVLGSHRRLNHNPLPDLAIAGSLNFIFFLLAYITWHSVYAVTQQASAGAAVPAVNVTYQILQDAPNLLLKLTQSSSHPSLLILIPGIVFLSLTVLLSFMLRAAILVRTFRDSCSATQFCRTAAVCAIGLLLTLGAAASVYFFAYPLVFLFISSSFYLVPPVLSTLMCIAVVHAYGVTRFLHSLRDIQLSCAAPGRYLLRAALYVLLGVVSPLLLLCAAGASLWTYYTRYLEPGIGTLPNWAGMTLMASLFIALVTGLLLPITAHACIRRERGTCIELVEPAATWEVRPCAELGCTQHCLHARLAQQPVGGPAADPAWQQEPQMLLHPLLRDYPYPTMQSPNSTLRSGSATLVHQDHRTLRQYNMSPTMNHPANV